MMRHYFSFEAKGGALFLPFLAAWALTVGGTAAYLCMAARFAVPEPLLDWAFAAHVLCRLLLAVLLQAAQCLALYFFVRATAGGVSLSGERADIDYPPRRYATLCVKGILLSTVTLGVYAPWFIRDLMRYFAEGTSLRLQPMEFRGSASFLFSYAVLLGVAPAFVICSVMPAVLLRARLGAEGMYVLAGVLWLVLLALLCVYRAVALKWYMHLAWGHRRIVSQVCGWRGGRFLLGQALLTVVTLGLYYPMALLRVWRYYADRLVLGREEIEGRFGFLVRPWSNYRFVLGQLLLSVVTLGLYYPWAYVRVASLLIGRTYVEEQPQREREPMPACDC